MKAGKTTCRAHYVAIVFVFGLLCSAASAKLVNYVIHISVDGLRPDAITNLGPTYLPNFYRMRTEGAFTDNARTDYDYTETLPNHTTQLTGRGVLGSTGHNWTTNTDPDPGVTLASNKGSYVAGAFDVAHDYGLRTGEYVSKSKFSLYDTSWNGTNGALDGTPPDNGRDKIDNYINIVDTLPLSNKLAEDMLAQPMNYVFLHFADPDRIGHNNGFDPTPGSRYSDTIIAMDVRLGVIFDMIDSDPLLSGRTVILLTSDHGGTGTNHANAGIVENYTIPFYAWGPGVSAGQDLYSLNSSNRQNPGTGRPTYAANPQPIRNGEVGNVALKVLGLPAIPGSTIGQSQDLALNTTPGSAPSAPTAISAINVGNCGFTARWNSVSGATGYLLDVATDSSFTNFVSGYQDIVVGNVLSFDVSGLAANTTHYYRVWAYNLNGTSGNSNTINLTTTSNVYPPITPTANAATNTKNTSFKARWSVGCGATGYLLDVSTSESFSSYVAGYQDLDVGNVTSWTVSDVNASTTYYYRVRAYNEIGSSANSNTASATTLDINWCEPGVLLEYGDMEYEDPYSVCPSWWSYSAGNGAPSWTKDATVKHGGLVSQRAKNINAQVGSMVGVRQTIDANVGDALTFEGWVYPVSNPAAGQQVALVARWDGSTANPDGSASWKTSTGLKNVWSKIQNFAGNATGTQVTLFLDSRCQSGSIDITAYWDDVVCYRAFVPPAPTVTVLGSSSLRVDVNPGCNAFNSSAEYSITIGGGAYTLGTHWVQANGTISTTAVWQTDDAWGTTDIGGLTSDTTYTFKTRVRYSGTLTQASSLGAGASAAPSGQVAPSITQHPSNQTIGVGETATFTVVAAGSSPLSYQWQVDGANLYDGNGISGSTTATLEMTDCQTSDQGAYRCVVTNAYGSATSNTASLAVTVCGTPSFANGNFETSTAANPPVNWTTYIQASKSGAFTIQSSTPPEGSQWQQTQVYNVDSFGGIYRTVTGLSNGAVYTIAGSYKSNSVSSTASVRYNLSGDASRANSTALASTTSTNWETFSGSITATGGTISLFLDHLNGGASNKAAGFDNITIALVSCPGTGPTITQQPSAQNVCPGANASFSVTASGDGTLSYQWQKDQVNLSNGGHYSGCTTASLSITGADTNDAANYRCVVTNAGGSATSNAAALTLKAATAISAHPSSQSIPAGGSANFSVSATGDGALAYQWQKNSVNLTNGGHYSGVTTATLTVSSADTNDAADYRCLVIAGCGNVTSDVATLTVTTCSTPALTNGDFESSTAAKPPTGWTTYVQSSKSGNWTIQTVSPPQGTQWQQTQVYNANSWGGIRQNVTGLTTSAVYVVSGSYKSNSTSSTAAVRYNLSGNSDRANSTILVSTSNTNWTTFSQTVTASGTSLMLFLDHLNGAATNKAAGFDNIKVTCAP